MSALIEAVCTRCGRKIPYYISWLELIPEGTVTGEIDNEGKEPLEIGPEFCFDCLWEDMLAAVHRLQTANQDPFLNYRPLIPKPKSENRKTVCWWVTTCIEKFVGYD